MQRSRLYKNRDKDADELRRRRADQSVELRKTKKDDQLQKRRNISLGELDETSPLKEKQVESVDDVSYDTVVMNMKNVDRMKRYEAVRACRQILSKAKNPPINEFYTRGVVEILIELLSLKDDDIVFESAWALTNIASGETVHTSAVVTGGAIPKLIELLKHRSTNIAEQSVWALGNIAGEGAKFRDLLIENGIVKPLLELLNRVWNDGKIVANIAWVLSNLCRNRDPPPPPDVIKSLLPILTQLLQFHQSRAVMVDTAWALSYVSDTVNNVIDDMIRSGCVPHLVRLLDSGSPSLISPALRAIGNLVIGTDEQTQAVIDQGVIPCLPALLCHEKSAIIKETCWLVSNLTAGNVQQIQAVIDMDIIPIILDIMQKGEFRTQKEACWVISNLINGGSPEQCAYLMNQHVVDALCDVLTVPEPRLIVLVLEAINRIFEVAEQYGQLEDACVNMETCGGLDKLESLQNHDNDKVYKTAYDLIARFFSGGDQSTSKTEEGDEAANGSVQPTQEQDEVFKFPTEQQSGETEDFHF